METVRLMMMTEKSRNESEAMIDHAGHDDSRDQYRRSRDDSRDNRRRREPSTDGSRRGHWKYPGNNDESDTAQFPKSIHPENEGNTITAQQKKSKLKITLETHQLRHTLLNFNWQP